MIKNVERVFIAASSSISALGKQQDLSKLTQDKATLSTRDVEDQQALYYSIKNSAINDAPIERSFESMIQLLIEQVDLLLAQTPLNKKQLQKTMLFIGSTSLDISCVKSDSTKTVWLSQTDRIGQQLVDRFALHSLHFTFNTACTAGANALLYATNFIKQHKTEHAIVIGFEFFNALSLNGFHSLNLISKTSVKPFSPTRDGLILGEGIGAVLLSKFEPMHEPNIKAQHKVKQDVKILNDNIVALTVEKALTKIAHKRAIKPEDFTYFLPHYSSDYFREKLFVGLENINFSIPYEKWFTNLIEKGNTGSASIFIMLEELFNSGRLQKGEKLLCYVPESGRFSSGFMQLTVV